MCRFEDYRIHLLFRGAEQNELKTVQGVASKMPSLTFFFKAQNKMNQVPFIFTFKKADLRCKSVGGPGWN